MSESPTPQEVAQVLEDAADLLLVRGRCRYEGVVGEPGFERYCVLGAMAEVSGLGDWVDMRSHPSVAALARHLDARVDEWQVSRGWPRGKARSTMETVYVWNDDVIGEEGDDFDVIDTLRLVAKDIANEATA